MRIKWSPVQKFQTRMSWGHIASFPLPKTSIWERLRGLLSRRFVLTWESTGWLSRDFEDNSFLLWIPHQVSEARTPITDRSESWSVYDHENRRMMRPGNWAGRGVSANTRLPAHFLLTQWHVEVTPGPAAWNRRVTWQHRFPASQREWLMSPVPGQQTVTSLCTEVSGQAAVGAFPLARPLLTHGCAGIMRGGSCCNKDWWIESRGRWRFCLFSRAGKWGRRGIRGLDFEHQGRECHCVAVCLVLGSFCLFKQDKVGSWAAGHFMPYVDSCVLIFIWGAFFQLRFISFERTLCLICNTCIFVVLVKETRIKYCYMYFKW